MDARGIIKALGGQWHGSYGMARCPAHEDKTPSLSIRDSHDGKLLTHCHAGCSPEAVWAALQDCGLVTRLEDRPSKPRRRARSVRRRTISKPEPSPNRDHALATWKASRPAGGTPAEAYLRNTGPNSGDVRGPEPKANGADDAETRPRLRPIPFNQIRYSATAPCRKG